VPYNNCLYQIDHGVFCSAWAKDSEEYCARHKEVMAKIDDLEKEIQTVIDKARSK
jgi:hypothetical protein